MIGLGQNNSTDCVSVIDTLTGQKIYEYPDTEAQPKGGMQNLLLRFTHEMDFKGPIQNVSPPGSMTIVRFVITKSGKITNKIMGQVVGRNI